MSREPFTMLPNRFIDSEMRGELSERQAKLCRYIARSASQLRSEAKLSLAQIVTGMRWEWGEDTLLRELKGLRPEWIDFESKPGQRGPYLIRSTGLAVASKGADLRPVELGSEPPTSAPPPHHLRKRPPQQPPHAEIAERTEGARRRGPRLADPACAASSADRASPRIAVDARRRSRRRRDEREAEELSQLRRPLETIENELDVDLVSHDFRRSLASFLIVAARADDAAVTAIMGHANIERTRRIYAGDWREAEERNAIVLRQLADAGRQ